MHIGLIVELSVIAFSVDLEVWEPGIEYEIIIYAGINSFFHSILNLRVEKIKKEY